MRCGDALALGTSRRRPCQSPACRTTPLRCWDRQGTGKWAHHVGPCTCEHVWGLAGGVSGADNWVRSDHELNDDNSRTYWPIAFRKIPQPSTSGLKRKAQARDVSVNSVHSRWGKEDDGRLSRHSCLSQSSTTYFPAELGAHVTSVRLRGSLSVCHKHSVLGSYSCRYSYATSVSHYYT